ncbi:hypothetical protein T484DRAFT_1808315 [Baffinella frigidus]|nr:hypothetical protein T484DRAFT_1808315 [Cryptophyta sp. CCMP2293]
MVIERGSWENYTFRKEKVVVDPREVLKNRPMGMRVAPGGPEHEDLNSIFYKSPRSRTDRDISKLYLAVGHLSFFQKLSERKARRICRLLTLEMYEDGAPVYHVGDETDRVFVLGSGVIKAYTYSPGKPPDGLSLSPLCIADDYLDYIPEREAEEDSDAAVLERGDSARWSDDSKYEMEREADGDSDAAVLERGDSARWSDDSEVASAVVARRREKPAPPPPPDESQHKAK